MIIAIILLTFIAGYLAVDRQYFVNKAKRLDSTITALEQSNLRLRNTVASLKRKLENTL
jgi:phage shock protein A